MSNLQRLQTRGPEWLSSVQLAVDSSWETNMSLFFCLFYKATRVCVYDTYLSEVFGEQGSGTEGLVFQNESHSNGTRWHQRGSKLRIPNRLGCWHAGWHAEAWERGGWKRPWVRCWHTRCSLLTCFLGEAQNRTLFHGAAGKFAPVDTSAPWIRLVLPLATCGGSPAVPTLRPWRCFFWTIWKQQESWHLPLHPAWLSSEQTSSSVTLIITALGFSISPEVADTRHTAHTPFSSVVAVSSLTFPLPGPCQDFCM